jgi:DKNYY family
LKVPTPQKFQLLGEDDYGNDSKHVFIMKHKISEADPASFKVLQKPYSRDSKHVYCGNVALRDVDVEAFEPVKCYALWVTAYEKNHFLFEYGDSFEKLEITKDHPVIVGQGWGRDGKHYYHGPGKVEGADYASFTIISQSKASDKDRKYFHVFPEEQLTERRKRFLGVLEKRK